MNIYRIMEDDQYFCMRGKSMQEVTKLCEDSYIEECTIEIATEQTTEEYEREHYHTNILQSCELVGELKN